MTIAIDFDGTIVEHRYPAIGPEIPFATDTIKMLIKQRYKIILWTVREGNLLDEAVEWCRERGIEFYAVNKDFPEEKGTENNNKFFSRKIKADLFIDDRNLGGLPDWGTMYEMISKHKSFDDLIDEARKKAMGMASAPQEKKKRWWQI